MNNSHPVKTPSPCRRCSKIPVNESDDNSQHIHLKTNGDVVCDHKHQGTVKEDVLGMSCNTKPKTDVCESLINDNLHCEKMEGKNNLSEVVSSDVQVSGYDKHCEDKINNIQFKSDNNSLIKVSKSTNNNNAHHVKLKDCEMNSLNGQTGDDERYSTETLCSTNEGGSKVDLTISNIESSHHDVLTPSQECNSIQNDLGGRDCPNSPIDPCPSNTKSSSCQNLAGPNLSGKSNTTSSCSNASLSEPDTIITTIMNEILNKLDLLVPTLKLKTTASCSSPNGDRTFSTTTLSSCVSKLHERPCNETGRDANDTGESISTSSYDEVFRDNSCKNNSEDVPSLPLSSKLPSSATVDCNSRNQLTVACNSKSPGASCPLDKKSETKVQARKSSSECSKESPTLEVKTDLELSAIMGLAHGLITGSHMDNLSSKLTNTLHDLAASLSRSKASELTSAGAEGSESSSVSKVQVEKPEPMSFEDVIMLQRKQWEDVIYRDQINRHKAASLHQRINRLRAKGLSCYSRGELTSLAKRRRTALSSEDKTTAWSGVFHKNDINNKHAPNTGTGAIDKESSNSRGSSPAVLDKRQLRRKKFLRKVQTNTGVY